MMKQFQAVLVLSLSLVVTSLNAPGIFFPGRSPPKFNRGAYTVEGFYVESDASGAAPFVVPSSAAGDTPVGEYDEAVDGGFAEGRGAGKLFSSLQSSSFASSKNMLRFVDYVTVTKVEPPLCVACTCLKGGLTETCAKYGGKQLVTLTATLNTSAAVVTAAQGCTVGTDGMTLTCSQTPVTFVITPTLTNGAVTVGAPTATPAGTIVCTGTVSPLSCTFTDAANVATTLSIPYTLGAAGIALTPAPTVDNTAVTCTVGATGATLTCVYTPPAFTTKVTVAVKPEVLAAVSGTGAKCTVAGTTITCLVDPPATLSVCDSSCLNSDGTTRIAPDICGTDCKFKDKNEVVKCDASSTTIISARPTQVCNSVRKRDVSAPPTIESSVEADSGRRHPREFQVFRTTSTIIVTATGSVTATYVPKAACLPVNMLSVPDC